MNWKQAGELLSVLALPVGVVGLGVVALRAARPMARANPRKARRSDSEVEEVAEQVIQEAGQAGGIDEVRDIAKKGWPNDGRFTQRERAAIKREAKRKLRS